MNKTYFSTDHWRNSGTGLTEMTLCAPTRRALLDAREHLRYWPYVKEFREKDYLKLRVIIFIGKGYSRKQWNDYCQRAMELLTLCVMQYKACFKGWTAELDHFEPQYTDNEFLRPDNLLQPMSNFFDANEL
ncbi:MAG: uracil-DNA glycosylase family protein [Bacteroidales bacterium]|nr:uracil-DNA glycosylase family protein [Bacteroidales bacterium]